MLQRVLQSKLLWSFALMMRRRHFEWTDQAYIRLIGKPIVLDSGSKYYPYLRLSYNDAGDDMWYYREDGMVGEASYQDVVRMSKSFIKHDKLRAIKCI